MTTGIDLGVAGIREPNAGFVVDALNRSGGGEIETLPSDGGLGAVAPEKEINHMDGQEVGSRTSDVLSPSPPQSVPDPFPGSWDELQIVIDRTPEDDHEAQWSAIEVCLQCSGPAKRACICTRCQAMEVEG